jgi:hypothetical protein
MDEFVRPGTGSVRLKTAQNHGSIILNIDQVELWDVVPMVR